MRNENRTDRILVLVALIILIIAGGAFYFDGWMWGGKRDRSDVIGLITKRSGDVRLKMEGDLKWQRANSNENLVYNDAVYAGGGSEAQLNLGESKLTVTENTLVVLRRDQNVNFMNLNYGTLFSRVAKNEKLVIDTGSGKPIEFSTAGGAEIILSKSGSQTQLDVKSGTAEVVVDGQRRKIDSSSKVILGEKPFVAKTGVNRLRVVKPKSDEVIYSDSPTELQFAWAWDDPRLNQPGDKYTLEFSTTPQFEKIHASKDVGSELSTTMNASRSLNLYFRVKGPENAMTSVERVRFVRLTRPIIVSPLAQQRFQAPLGGEATVPIQFERPDGQVVWYQVARDQGFQNLIFNESTDGYKALTALPEGQYYIRARGDFGDNQITDWSSVHPFSVLPPPTLQLTQTGLPTRVVISNRDYPVRLYGAPDNQVRDYLRSQNFLGNFFRLDPQSFDELKVQFDETQEQFSQNSPHWPTEKLHPGKFRYQYQTSKEGFSPSEWSPPRNLEIVMEPPRPVGVPKYSEADFDGNREASWDFTPILYAGSYDVQLSGEPGFSSPQEFSTNSATVQRKLASGSAYWWRARARDKRGRVISEYSSGQRLSPPSYVPQFIARSGDRRPQATERVRTKVERIKDDTAWIHNGWWAWVGTGMNYTDYRQSIPNGDEGATLNTQNAKGPSQYLETGYTGKSGWGGVVSYKRTPGEIVFTDGQTRALNPEYVWTTTSVEGIMRRMSRIKMLNRPLLMGFRAGIQQHKIPFIVVSSDPDTGNGIAQVKNNNIMAGSLGMLAEMNRNRWIYYWLMRYQFPLSTSADGASQFEVKPTFAFDGSVGVSYNFTEQMKFGVFWYGQWHQFNFTYSDGANSSNGFQSLFYSNIDARLGIDF